MRRNRLPSLCSIALFVTLAASQVSAREKIEPLPPEIGAELAGRSLTIARHDKPSFIAGTAGKAGFALLGTAAMVANGNRLVRENAIADPADIVASTLAPALATKWQLVVEIGEAVTVPSSEVNVIAGAVPGGDLVLDVRSTGWSYTYFPTRWGSYWVGYGVQVRLIDLKRTAIIANMFCGADTRKHPHPPSREQLVAEQAQLLKDILANLAWTCARQLAHEEFDIADIDLPPIPAQLLDPLGSLPRLLE